MIIILFVVTITDTKCYDEETKSAYKVDSIWYPVGKCEKRTCSRQKDSKTPTIKTVEYVIPSNKTTKKLI